MAGDITLEQRIEQLEAERTGLLSSIEDALAELGMGCPNSAREKLEMAVDVFDHGPCLEPNEVPI